MWVDQRVQTISWGLSLSRPWPSSAFLHVSFLLYKSPSEWKALWSAGLESTSSVETWRRHSSYFHPNLRSLNGSEEPILGHVSPSWPIPVPEHGTITDWCSVTRLPVDKEPNHWTPWDLPAIHIPGKAIRVQKQNKNKQTHKSLADKRVSGFVLLKKRVTSTDTLNFVSFFEESGVMGSYVEKACRWTCGPGSGRNIIKVSTMELLTNIAEASREGRNSIP